jgi:hypothetical protein
MPAIAREGHRAEVAGIANELAVRWIKYQPSWLVRPLVNFFPRDATLETAALRFEGRFRPA